MTDVYKAQGEKQKDKDPEIERNKEKYDIQGMVESVLTRVNEQRGRYLGGAYNVCPGKRFVDEQVDEEMVLLLRAHPVTNLKWMMISIIMIVFPEILVVLGLFAGLPGAVVLVIRAWWYLVVFAYAFEKFTDWYYSVYIVTNERIVKIDFVNLLSRTMAFASLNHIEEPSMQQGGIFRAMFKFGDVFVATAADEPPIEFHAVPYPDRVISVISELSEELEKRRETGL